MFPLSGMCRRERNRDDGPGIKPLWVDGSYTRINDEEFDPGSG